VENFSDSTNFIYASFLGVFSMIFNPFKAEARTALFKDPVRTAL